MSGSAATSADLRVGTASPRNVGERHRARVPRSTAVCYGATTTPPRTRRGVRARCPPAQTPAARRWSAPRRCSADVGDPRWVVRLARLHRRLLRLLGAAGRREGHLHPARVRGPPVRAVLQDPEQAHAGVHARDLRVSRPRVRPHLRVRLGRSERTCPRRRRRLHQRHRRGPSRGFCTCSSPCRTRRCSARVKRSTRSSAATGGSPAVRARQPLGVAGQGPRRGTAWDRWTFAYPFAQLWYLVSLFTKRIWRPFALERRRHFSCTSSWASLRVHHDRAVPEHPPLGRAHAVLPVRVYS